MTGLITNRYFQGATIATVLIAGVLFYNNTSTDITENMTTADTTSTKSTTSTTNTVNTTNTDNGNEVTGDITSTEE